MITEAIEKIIDLAEIQLHADASGREWASREVFPLETPVPASVPVCTLDGLADATKLIGDVAEDMLVILGPTHVGMCSMLCNDWGKRSTHVVAQTAALGDTFKFGHRYDTEEFIIAMQALFVPTENVAKILEVVGHMSNEAVQTLADDGVTQTVSQKAGVVLRSKAAVPNPVALRPFRTFREIEQPESKFIFRVHQHRDGASPQCALYEADGGMWKLTAMKSIKEYLAKVLPEFKVVT